MERVRVAEEVRRVREGRGLTISREWGGLEKGGTSITGSRSAGATREKEIDGPRTRFRRGRVCRLAIE